jgi:hypothetical protein
MRLSWLTAVGSVFLAAVLAAPAWGEYSAPHSAVPGTLNYVEGQASINGQALDAGSIGTAELGTGQSLTTTSGKAEVLLTPGVFLRADDNSSVKMISPSLTFTEIGVEKGQAMVEVAEIHPQNDLRVMEDGATTHLLKTGLYDFDANQGQVRVFDGKAFVQKGDQGVTLQGGHEVNLNLVELRAQKFDKKAYEAEDLYRWSSLRSSYLAEASAATAPTYFVNGWYGPGWFGAGWYWNLWFGEFTFIPASGIFYDPFGWGFYSPLAVYRTPLFYFGRFHRKNDRDNAYLGQHRQLWPNRDRGHDFGFLERGEHSGPSFSASRASAGFGGRLGFSGRQ